MPSPVPTYPALLSLRDVNVGRPVAMAHGMALGLNPAFILGHAVHPAVVTRPARHLITSGSLDFTLFYRRTPGAHVLRLAAVLDTDTAGKGSLTIPGMTLPNGIDWLRQGQWNGTNWDAPPPNSRIAPELAAWLDLEGFARGSIGEIPLRLTRSAGSVGLAALLLSEVPIAFSAPETDSEDPGIVLATTLPPHVLVDGSASTPEGWVRFQAEQRRCWTDWPRTLQACSAESSTSPLASVTSTSFQPAYTNSNGTRCCFRTRARRVFDTGTPDKYTLCVRFANSHASIDGTFRVSINGTPGPTIALPHTSGVWTTAQSTLGAIELPTNTTNQLAKIDFDMKCNSAGPTIRTATIALIAERTAP